MKSLKTLIAYFSSFLLFSILSSCEKEPSYESFIIKVDSIQVPNNISINKTFDIKFFGTVGTNGCYQFSQFKTEEQGNIIMIEAWGRFDKNTYICPSVMVYLNNEKLNYLIKEKGIYTIKIKQPDDNYFEQQISIE